MAPLNYQHQHDRQLEDGLAPHGDKKVDVKETPSVAPKVQPETPQRSRKMNLRRFTLTFGVGLLVGFGLVTANRSRPQRPLCSKEIHASTEHEMKALVEQTKEDTSALGEILRCASPETFHRLVSVYFPDRSQPGSDDSRSADIGKDETWLLTAWEKLVKRQEDGAQNPATPTDAATDDAADPTTSTVVVTQDPVPTTSDPPVNNDPSTTDAASDPQPDPTTSNPPPDTDTGVDEPTTVDEPPSSSSTTEEIPETTSEEPVTTEEPVETTSTTSSDEPVETTTEAPEETSSSSTTKDDPEPSTSEQGMSLSEEQPFSSSFLPSSSSSSAPPPSSSSSESESSSTLPKETTTSHDDDSGPSKTTIHSTAVRQTITSTNEGGGVTTITSTSWVAVDPPHETDQSDDDPSLQDAGLSLRANVGPAAIVGGLVAALLMT